MATSLKIKSSKKAGSSSEADISCSGKSKFLSGAKLLQYYPVTNKLYFAFRRYAVLTKDFLLTFVAKGQYTNPTEAIKMEICSTVKSADDEINKEFSFKLDIGGTTFYFHAESYEEKEGWIGALGRAMIKPSIMIDEAFDNEYM